MWKKHLSTSLSQSNKISSLLTYTKTSRLMSINTPARINTPAGVQSRPHHTASHQTPLIICLNVIVPNSFIYHSFWEDTLFLFCSLKANFYVINTNN